MVREPREIKRKPRAKAVGGIKKDMDNLGKDLERTKDEARTDKATLASAKAKANMLVSEIEGVRERSEGGYANYRAAVDRDKAAAGRDRDEAKRPHTILEEEKAQRYGIIDELQRFRRDEDDFDWRMYNIGLQGDKRG